MSLSWHEMVADCVGRGVHYDVAVRIADDAASRNAARRQSRPQNATSGQSRSHSPPLRSLWIERSSGDADLGPSAVVQQANPGTSSVAQPANRGVSANPGPSARAQPANSVPSSARNATPGTSSARNAVPGPSSHTHADPRGGQKVTARRATARAQDELEILNNASWRTACNEARHDRQGRLLSRHSDEFALIVYEGYERRLREHASNTANRLHQVRRTRFQDPREFHEERQFLEQLLEGLERTLERARRRTMALR